MWFGRYMREKNFQGVWKVYNGMKQYTDIMPDEVTYTTMIRACAKQQMVEKVSVGGCLPEGRGRG